MTWRQVDDAHHLFKRMLRLSATFNEWWRPQLGTPCKYWWVEVVSREEILAGVWAGFIGRCAELSDVNLFSLWYFFTSPQHSTSCTKDSVDFFQFKQLKLQVAYLWRNFNGELPRQSQGEVFARLVNFVLTQNDWRHVIHYTWTVQPVPKLGKGFKWRVWNLSPITSTRELPLSSRMLGFINHFLHKTLIIMTVDNSLMVFIQVTNFQLKLFLIEV